MSKFKVGDKVRIVTEKAGSFWDSTRKMDKWLGKVMTVNVVCGGYYKMEEDNKYWAWFPSMIAGLAEPPRHEIHITCTDGKTTHAVKKVDGKITARAKAVCAPDDEFNFDVGASIAYDRIMHPELFAEPAKEPVKLYCVADRSNYIVTLTKGKVYEFVNGDGLTYDNGRKSIETRTYERWARDNQGASSCLVPLVSRPAKVGEWVLITADSVDGTEKGEICEVVGTNRCSANHMYLRTKKPTVYGHRGITPRTLAAHSEYLVLDGYKPEPEKAEPEYYSGKVVCVDSAGYYHTVGKTYTVVDGFLIDDSGTKVPYLTGPVTSVDDLNSRSACKFAVLLDE